VEFEKGPVICTIVGVMSDVTQQSLISVDSRHESMSREFHCTLKRKNDFVLMLLT